MTLPVDGYISSALRTTGEFKVGLDDIVTDAARGNPEFTSTRTFEKGAKVKASNDIVFTSMIDGNVANTPQADDGSNWYASVFDNVLGDWSDKTGLVSAGSGLYHNGVLWRVESDIADVTLSNPSDNNASYSKSAGGSVFDFVVSQYSGGDKSKVAYITAGLSLAAYDWFVDTNALQVFSKNGATGAFSDPLDFDPATGIDSGVTGVLVQFNAISETRVSVIESDITALEVGKLDKADLDLLTGSATFTNVDNNVSMTGIGLLGLEIGDVVEFKDSALNTGYFTLEILTDDNNHVFNYEHRGGITEKSLVNETSTVTVSLISKWNVADYALGRSECVPATARASSATYTNNSGRAIEIYIKSTNVTDFKVGTFSFGSTGTNNSSAASSTYATIPSGQTYFMQCDSLLNWTELR